MGKEILRYILLVIDEDGTLTAYGPFNQSTVSEREMYTKIAFPNSDVRSLLLLRFSRIYD